MEIGKAVSLRVRPNVSADLCYPIDGVIDVQSGLILGREVGAHNLAGLFLDIHDTEEDDPSRLKWNFWRIRETLTTSPDWHDGSNVLVCLSRLRNESQAAELDGAIRMRQNAYLTSYSPDVLAEVRRVFYDNPEDPNAVQYELIAQLESDARGLHQGLADAYKRAGIWGKIVRYAISTYDNKATQYTGTSTVHFEGISETRSQGFEFRHPSVENDVRYHRARLDLGQEYLNAWRMAQMCRYGETTFSNELKIIDEQILKLQMAYIDTFLISSIPGRVTAVFHGQGDYVRAGEPVVRVESDELIYLVGTIKYRGMLRVGSEVKVTTRMFDAPGGQPTVIKGVVSAVQGHDSVDEQWDVLILCENRDASGKLIFPLNYSFSFDNTTVEVTAL